MGGCRCSYRNCKVKSDGKTHMFHYPVFDKVRCHQWLTNTHRLEYLDLKVSQLKNRVVCQNHFRDDQFMNFMKDKLIFDAVPTKSGPYCDEPTTDNVPETDEICPIALEDIENDQLSLREKKANFSVKYGHFLTNCDTMPVMINKKNNLEDTTNISNTHNFSYHNTLKVSLPSEINKHQIQPMLVVPPFLNDNNNASCYEIEKESHNNNDQISNKSIDVVPTVTSSQGTVKKNNVVKIISEEKISEPVSFKGNFEPVSPSLILYANHNTKDIKRVPSENEQALKLIELKSESNIKDENISQQVDSIPVGENMPTDNLPRHKTRSQTKLGCQTPLISILKNKLPPESKVSQSAMSLLKNKITPERVAAIEEKRCFNKKLRDMIEFCLDELDDQDKSTSVKTKLNVNEKKLCGVGKTEIVSSVENDVTISRLKKITKAIQKDAEIRDQSKTISSKEMDNNSQNLTNIISKRKPTNLPAQDSSDDNNISIEVRLKRMEDTLLNKINENSQQIIDLQMSLTSPVIKKKSTPTQTTKTEEAYKKHLYQEISKFLSPNLNNLIYEELFLNIYAPSSPVSSPPHNSSHNNMRRHKRRRLR